MKNTLLVIDTQTMIAKRFVNGEYTTERVHLDPSTYNTDSEYKHAITNFRLNGFGQ